MADKFETSEGSNILLKWAAASFIVSYLTGAMAKGIEEAEQEQERQQRENQRRATRSSAPGYIPHVARGTYGEPIILPDGSPLMEQTMPPANPGAGGSPRRFMNPDMPGPGYMPRNDPRRRGRTTAQIITDRENKWYREHGYVQRDGKWVLRKRPSGNSRRRKRTRKK